MRYALLFFLLCSLHAFLPAQPCNCPEQFDFLTQKIAANYAGYSDKVNPATRAAFDAHTTRYRALAAPVTTDTTCARLLYEWTLFFKDRHLQLSYNPPPDDTAAIRRRFADWEKIGLDEAAARARIDRPDRDSIEGIWEMQGGNYRVALLRQPAAGRDYAAVVLRADSVWWMPGFVKFELKTAAGGYQARFFMRDHSLREFSVAWRGDELRFGTFSTWQRVYPGAGELPKDRKQQTFFLEKLDSATLLITLPTMNESLRHEFKSLVKANRKLLATTPNLIIDVRGNGGGSDLTYYPLKRYLYTQPVRSDRVQYWATRDNADKFAEMGRNKDFPWTWRMYGRHMARKMRRNEGKFIGKTGQGVEKMNRVTRYPQRVVVLIDGGCASSCEQFALFAQQSKKTTLIGRNTAGVLDYSNLHFLPFPDRRFTLAYPTTRSNRVAEGRGIDNVGVAPAVRLSEADGDWVEWTRRYLRR